MSASPDPRGRLPTPEEDARRKRAIRVLAGVIEPLVEHIGLELTLDSLMTIWLNLALASEGKEWARQGLGYARETMLEQIALGRAEPEGQA